MEYVIGGVIGVVITLFIIALMVKWVNENCGPKF
jgi:hypothetical protein